MVDSSVVPFVLVPGVRLRFEYPAANYLGVPPRWESRQLFVERVRLLDAAPLDLLTIPRNPLLDRGRVLVTGKDIDKGAERSFYVESMRNVEEMPEPRYGEEPEAPQLFSVVEIAGRRVVARALPRAAADAFAKQWAIRHGMTATVLESVNWPTDDQVLEQLQLAP